MADGVAPFSTAGVAPFANAGVALFSNAGHDGEDRISALPEDLLRAIISLLPVTDAARTAALASRWRHIWRSTPLVLRDADLPEHSRAAAVSQILTDHPGPFRTVLLSHCRSDSELGEWARLLAAKGTQEVVFVNNPTHTQPNPVRLPADILRCTSLQSLFLDFWMFPADLSRGANNIILPHLRTLIVLRVEMKNKDLEYLIAACPVLETLQITRPKNVRLRSRSLRCALIVLSMAEDFAVVDAPLLERLVLFLPDDGLRVKIAGAANLRVVGHLDTRVQKLQIGDSVIGPNTMASTSTVIPSVKILAVKVNFGVLVEAKMLASFLRCFPNIDTLHIESALHDPSVTAANEPGGEHHAKFWQEVSPVECLRSHMKNMVIHKLRGDQNEFEFLKFIAMNAQELQSLHFVLQEENISQTAKVKEIKDKLQCLRFRTGIIGALLVSPKVGYFSRLQKANDLTVEDPFCC